MTQERKEYFSSAKYRATIKVGDEMVAIEDGRLLIGKVLGIERMIEMLWNDGRTTHNLYLGGGRIPACRIEDLTPEEKTEVVTLRLST